MLNRANTLPGLLDNYEVESVLKFYFWHRIRSRLHSQAFAVRVRQWYGVGDTVGTRFLALRKNALKYFFPKATYPAEKNGKSFAIVFQRVLLAGIYFFFLFLFY